MCLVLVGVSTQTAGGVERSRNPGAVFFYPAGEVHQERFGPAVGVHPVHLSRTFPRRCGMTVGDYVRALRLDYAARQLMTTRRPIADIALDAGFSSQAHLTRQFRARLGVPPGAFRAAC